jgi:PAS domain S-box-containing protein
MDDQPNTPDAATVLRNRARWSVPWIMLAGSVTLSVVAAIYVAFGAQEGMGAGLAVGIGGLLLSWVLFWMTRAEVLARTQAESGASALARSQEAVRSSEHRFRTLFEQSPLSIQIFAPDGRCVLANHAWEELWGASASELGDYNVLQDPQLAASGMADQIKRAFAGEKVAMPAIYYDPSRIGKPGRPRWVAAQLYPVQDKDEAVLELVLIHQDVTDRKHAEEERSRLLAAEREARASAEAANRTKDEFLATLSHELRTPLNAILGWSQLLRMGGVQGEEFQHALETIERNGRAQARLVDDLLDLSRIITGKLKLEAQVVDLPTIVDAALDSVRPTAEARGVRLLPVLDSHATPVKGDANRLQQIAWNLLTNAVKFTPQGGRVEVYLTRVDDRAELVVNDTGAGISPEFLPYVFDRLRQADSSSTRRHGGLGLGLAIVRHLVELHGGDVRANSAGLGHGATFTVSLPLAKTAKTTRTNNGSTPGSATPHVLDGVRVLVVEDEADARELVSKILKIGGAEVTAVASASEAMKIFSGLAPQVLLSDISMPDEDGYALIRRIRALPDPAQAHTPAIAVTALARKEDRRDALDAGYQRHITKPIDPGALTKAVAELAHAG